MAPREELLLILDLTSTVLRAGVGVADLIRGPLLELPTRLGRKLNTKGTQVEDYLVGHYLSEAERTGSNEHEVVYPLQVDPKVGFIVTDWVGLEAIFRYAFHISLQLPRPPLLHPTVLSVPPSLPHSTTDSLHRLLFERLLVPSLLLSSRPFFAAGASGVTSGVILDIGWRGEGCEVSVVHDSQVYEAPGGSRVSWVDEGVLDDYCAVKIWEENRETLLDGFGKAQEEGKELSQSEILDGVRRIVGELKNRDLIGFKSKLYTPPVSLQALGDTVAGGEEDGQFDVAKVVAEGKVGDIVKKSKSKSKTTTSDDDFVTIPNPFSPPPPPPQIDLTIPVAEIPEHANLQIGPSRHLYLEPLFFPQVLSTTLSSTNSAAKEIGLTYFERIEVPKFGIQEVIGSVLTAIKDLEVKEAVCENLIVISSGRVASNRALGSTLLPLLSPYSATPQQPDQSMIDQAITPRGPMRYARTPEYFANFKEHAGDWGVYLGACIMGKLLIGDQQAKLFMSKAEYTQKGPAYYRQMEIIP